VLSVAVYHIQAPGLAGRWAMARIRSHRPRLAQIQHLADRPPAAARPCLAQTPGRTAFDVPFCGGGMHQRLTEAGYVGEDVGTILLRLLQKAEWMWTRPAGII